MVCSLIIYDNVTKELYGARDRFGIKPYIIFQTLNQSILHQRSKLLSLL